MKLYRREQHLEKIGPFCDDDLILHHLLSGELVTKLTGRYVEFEVFTLSFAEFLGMKRHLGREARDLRSEFEECLRYGGFPRSLEYGDPEAKARYIEDVANQIIEKDIKPRKSLRGEEKYYLANPGIFFARNVDVRMNYGPALENALYLYLRARGREASQPHGLHGERGGADVALEKGIPRVGPGQRPLLVVALRCVLRRAAFSGELPRLEKSRNR